MNTWFLVVVKFTKEFTDGTLKRVSEHHLISAVSFTDAERSIYQEVGQYVRGEFTVQRVAKKNISDIFVYDDSDNIYECKVSYISEDADSGKEKKFVSLYLVDAKDIKEAHIRIEESLKGLMITFDITVIVKSKIVEIFPFDGVVTPIHIDTEEE